MQDRFPFAIRNNYPHMKPGDVAIWERFIRAFPDAYDWVQYDLAVGEGAEFDTTVHPEQGTHMNELYQRKIDVVGYKNDQIDIIEVKPQAGSSAIGQVKMYQHLFVRDFSPAVPPKAVILTDIYSRDVAEFAAAQGVTMVQV